MAVSCHNPNIIIIKSVRTAFDCCPSKILSRKSTTLSQCLSPSPLSINGLNLSLLSCWSLCPCEKSTNFDRLRITFRHSKNQIRFLSASLLTNQVYLTFNKHTHSPNIAPNRCYISQLIYCLTMTMSTIKLKTLILTFLKINILFNDCFLFDRPLRPVLRLVVHETLETEI